MIMYIGLDVHSKKTVYCVQDAQGQIVGRGRVDTNKSGICAMIADLQVPESTQVALETGTQAHWIAEILIEAGMNPVVVDAQEVRVKAPRRGQKCDDRDAFEICDGLRRDQWQKKVWLPPAELRRAREILSRRRHFVKLATMQVNAVKFLLRSRGLAIKRSSLGTDAGWLRLLATKLPEDTLEFITMHYAVWQQAKLVIAKLEDTLDKAMDKRRSEMDLLRTTYGIGPITAAGFLAGLGSAKRFASSNHVVSYIGLAPSTYDTGQCERHGHITRQGSSWLRALMIEAAHQARRPTHPLNPYYRRISAKTGVKCAAVAVAAHLSRILWRIWRDAKPFDMKKLNVYYQPQERTKTVFYHLKNEQPALPGKTTTQII